MAGEKCKRKNTEIKRKELRSESFSGLPQTTWHTEVGLKSSHFSFPKNNFGNKSLGTLTTGRKVYRKIQKNQRAAPPLRVELLKLLNTM